MKTNSKKIGLLTLLAVFFVSFAAFALVVTSPMKTAKGDGYALVYNNRTGYTIVVDDAESSGGDVYYAGYFIQQRIKDATGVSIPIKRDSGSNGLSWTNPANTKVISIGLNDFQAASGVTFDDDALTSDDGFYIKTKDKSVFIYGKTAAGLQNGALEFLECVLGAKFFADDIYIPTQTSVYLPDMDICDNPDFDLRSYGDWYGEHSEYANFKLRTATEFVSKNAQYGYDTHFFRGLDADGNKIYGGTHEQGGNPEPVNYIHNTLFDLVPYWTYYPSHPNWYDNGGRDIHWSNVGLNADGSLKTGDSVVKVAIETMKDWIERTDSSVIYFPIGQADYTNFCTCSACTSAAATYGKSGLVIRFVNAISDAIKTWQATQSEPIKSRDIRFVTLAYQWSVEAPVTWNGTKYVAKHSTVVPRDNVYVRICPITQDNYYALTDEAHQPSEYDDLFEKWNALTDNLMMWSYNARYNYIYTYYPTMQHWARDFADYKAAGVSYVFMEAQESSKETWQGHLQSYVASKMLWDITRDPAELQTEYISAYYRGIVDEATEFIENFENLFAALESAGNLPDMTIQGGDGILQSTVYGKSFWATQMGLLDDMFGKAETLPLSAAEKALLIKKIKMFAITVYSTILYDYDDYGFSSSFMSKGEMQNLFFTYCNDLLNINAGNNVSISDLKEEWGYVDFDMVDGASIRVTTGSTGIRFKAKMTDAYYTSLTEDDTRVFGFVIAPTSYFDGIAVGSDYISALEAKKAAGTVPQSPLIISTSDPFQDGGTDWYIQGSIGNIKYDNSNKSFTGIAYIRTGAKGNYTYTYANLGSLANVSRSVSDIAAKARNLSNATELFNEDELEVIDNFIKYGANKANGVSEDNKENTPTFTVSIDNTDVLYGVGEKVTLSCTLSPALNVQVVWTSSDETVAKIENGNKLVCLKDGTATITATCGTYTDTLDITVSSFAVTAPSYLAIGKTAALSVTASDGASNLGSATYTSSNGSIVSVSGNVITAVAVGTATITVAVTNTAEVKTVKVTVINPSELFGTAGVSKDFSEYSALWKYNNLNGDTVSVSYSGSTAVADGNSRKRFALTYDRPLNDGTGASSGKGNIYLDKDIVATALAKGYKYLTFYFKSSAYTYVAPVDKDGYGVGTNIYTGTPTNWQFCAIDLSSVELNAARDSEDFGIGLYSYAQYLYIADVRFVGGDVSGEVATALADNLAQEGVFDKAFIRTMDASMDIALEDGTITFTKNSNSISYDKGNYTYNAIYLDADWIQAAKKLGYTRVQFYAYASASAAGNIYRVAYSSMTSTANSVWNGTFTASPKFINVDLDSFEAGDKLMITFNAASGQTLELKDVEFKSGDLVEVTAITFGSSDYYLVSGETLTLTPTFTPANASDKTITYTSSNSNVLSVNIWNGVVSAVGTGTATLTATAASGVTATCTIHVNDFGIPEFIAIGQSVTLNSNYTYSLTSGGSYATLSSYTLKGTAKGTVKITANGSVVNTIKVIDITKDLSEDTSLWKFNNNNSDSDVTATYSGSTAVADGSNRKRFALTYHRSLNDGNSSSNGLLYLDSDIIAAALDKGYTYLTYYFKCAETGYATATNANGAPVGSWYNQNTAANWRFAVIDISAIDRDEFGIGFYSYSENLYLADVKFVGGDVSGEVAINLMSNLAKTGVYNKAFIRTMDASMDITLASGTITFTKNSNSISYDKGNYTNNAIYLDADWIQAAKKLGYTRVQFYAYATSKNSAGSIYRVAYNSMTSTANSVWSETFTTSPKFINVDLTSFVAGDKLMITFNAENGQTLKISNVEFKKTAAVAVTGITFGSSDYYLASGETLALKPTVTPSGASDKKPVYTSSNTSVATVNAITGEVTAVGTGTATITATATSNSVAGTCTIHVNEFTLPKYMGVGQTVELDTTHYSYAITSGSANASLSGNELTGTADGTITITVNGKYEIADAIRVIDFTTVDFATDTTLWGYHTSYSSDTVTITTEEDVADSKATPVVYDALKYYRAQNDGSNRSRTNNMLYLHPDIIAAALELGYTRFYFKIYIPATGSDTTSKYIVMNAQEDGNVPTNAGGTNVILAEVANNAQWSSKSMVFKITENLATAGLHEGRGIGFALNGQSLYLSKVYFGGVTLEETSAYLNVGDTYQLEPVGMNSYEDTFTYSSSNTSVATVSAAGLITTAAVGSATITVTAPSYATVKFTVNVLPEIPDYIAKGETVTMVDGLTYTITSGAANVSIENGVLTATGDGNVAFSVDGKVDYAFRVIDFGNTTGTNRDLANDPTLWGYHDTLGDTVSITSASAVADSRGSGDTAYAFDALDYYRAQNTGTARARTNNMLYLHPGIISAAKAVGYQYLTFYIYIPTMNDTDSTTNYLIMNCKEDGDVAADGGSTNTIKSGVNNSAKWTYITISLTTVNNNTVGLHEGRGIGFAVNGQHTYLAKVEFVGADISEFASNYITASATAGKSVDLVNSALLGTMWQTSDNINNTLTYSATGGHANSGNAYIEFTRTGGYAHTTYGYSINQVNNLILSSDWIQAAKELGYNMIGLRYYCPNTKGGIAFVKKCANGTSYYSYAQTASGDVFHAAGTSWGFISVDLSTYEAGDYLVIASAESYVRFSDITLRSTANFTPNLVLKTS